MTLFADRVTFRHDSNVQYENVFSLRVPSARCDVDSGMLDGS